MVREEQIKELAYAIWEEEGHPEGKDVEHYYRAKLILEQGEAAHVIELGPPQPTDALPASPSAVGLTSPQRRHRSFTRHRRR